jgi:hypothetical protein
VGVARRNERGGDRVAAIQRQQSTSTRREGPSQSTGLAGGDERRPHCCPWSCSASCRFARAQRGGPGDAVRGPALLHRASAGDRPAPLAGRDLAGRDGPAAGPGRQIQHRHLADPGRWQPPSRPLPAIRRPGRAGARTAQRSCPMAPAVRLPAARPGGRSADVTGARTAPNPRCGCARGGWRRPPDRRPAGRPAGSCRPRRPRPAAHLPLLPGQPGWMRCAAPPARGTPRWARSCMRPRRSGTGIVYFDQPRLLMAVAPTAGW